jgi:glycosyltransferase involved in cell wall biosynthesis
MSDTTTTDRVLSVVIPAYNEEKTIAQILRQVDGLSCVREIIVVDDCSSDSTAAVVKSFDSPRVKLIAQSPNQGKTAAVRRGLSEVTGPLCIIQDADLEYDPAEIPQVIAPIISGKADVVYGSRFLVSRAARVLYFSHFMANRFLTFLSDLLTNYNMSDIETCYKAFRTPIIKSMPLTSSGFGMEVEITAMISKTKARVFEVPISYYGRTYEEGKKIGLKDGFAALWYIFYYNVCRGYSAKCKQYVKSINGWLAEQHLINDHRDS